MRQVFNPHTGKPDYIVDPDTIARSLYGLGVMVVVAGPMVAGTDPPQMAPSTAVQVAHLLSIGIPAAYIGWNVTGSETGTSGSFTLPSVTLTPVIAAPSLSGLQGGTFALPIVTLQPQVVAPTLTGVQVGAFALPSVTMQPQVSSPTLFGVQAGVGVFAIPSVTLQPQVTPPTLAGVQVGSFALPAVTVQPQVSAPSLIGLQVGSFALPAVSLRPVVTAPTLAASVAATSGSFTLPAVTLQPIVTAPTLTGVSGGSGPTTHTFETLTDSSGTAWTPYIDPDIGDGYVGTIETGVAGGYTGNCMKIKPAIYDDGIGSLSPRDTHIMRSGLTIHAGDITLKAKLAQTTPINGVYIEINGTRTSFTNITISGWTICSVTIPSTISNATVKLGALSQTFQPAVLIDDLYIP